MKPAVFVMSDVVGSTALWEAHGDSMRVALEAHDRLVHEAMASAGGRVFKHTGDGMIAVFDDADDAVAAATAAVDGLAGETWGDTGPLQVRVSVHAGAASQRDGDFFGSPVNKVARINGVGHSGQVLASDVVFQLMSNPSAIDLGLHQLRDLSEPVRLWQFGEETYPPLRTLKSARHNLPVMPSEFIGRQTEVDELRGLVKRHRLVTITGVGGCGKTRLAVEVAAAMSDQFSGGVWFVDLTAERDGNEVGARAMRALGLAETPGDVGPVDVLEDATGGAPTLLIVDNCEHLIDDVADFAESLLARALSITVLATSREGLSVDGERIWRIPNMHDAAVELFIDRAAAAGVVGLEGRLDQIETICGQLDDIPLAIELAAARVSSLSIDELSARLDDRFSLLGGGRGRRRQRQQTLQTMMDWSYSLLTTDEQTVLSQLSVFAGTFPIYGAEAVAVASDTTVLDVLESLVEQSLIVPSVDSGRYRLLETVRIYALDRLLNTNQLAETRDRHLGWMVSLSGRERLLSLKPGEAWEAEERKLAEVENAIAAMEWAEQTDNQDALLSLFVGGVGVWGTKLSMTWLDRIPEPPTDRPDLRYEWLQTCGHLRYSAGDLAGGFEQLLEAAAIIDELPDADPRPLPNPIALLYRTLFSVLAGDRDAAELGCELMLELQADDKPRWAEWCSLQARFNILSHYGEQGALAVALEAIEVGRTVSRAVRDPSLAGLATHMAEAGRFEEALTATLNSLSSPVLMQSGKIAMIPVAVQSLAGLGRHHEALQIIDTDFGPMMDLQRKALRVYRLTALALILHHLKRIDDFEHVASLAFSKRGITDGYTVYRHLVRVAGGHDMLALLPTPSADLTESQIDALIDAQIAELRDHIDPDTAD